MESDWEILEFDFAGFEWDDDKAERNIRKHGVDFEDASKIFKGRVMARPQYENEEDRWQSVGIANGRELIVIFTEREKVCRVISARRADRKTRARNWYIR